MSAVLDDPSADEKFYARALAILVGPSRRMALAMRVCNLVYWISVMTALAWLASQALDRQSPVVIHAVDLLTPHIRPGEPVRVSYDLTRRRTCVTDLTWSFYDGAGEIHNFGPLHIEAAGPPTRERYTRVWATPPDAAPGNGRLRVILAFQCPGNYLQALYPVTLLLPDLAVRIDPPLQAVRKVGVPAGVGTSEGVPPGPKGGSVQPGGSTTSPPGPGTPTPGPGCGTLTGSPGESSPGAGG